MKKFTFKIPKSKRIISLALAGVMAFSSFSNFSITSFASTESNESSVYSRAEEIQETEETKEATPTDASSETTDLIVFDHYYSDIDESLVTTTDLIMTTNNAEIFTKNTNVISNYDNAYIISCDSVEEARYVYSYYVDKADTISDLSKSISISTEDTDEDVADLSDINNDTDVLSTLNDIDTKNYSGYIALIDTGADADVSFSVISDDTSDDNGHGTKMLNLITENNPDAKVMSIKVSEGSKTDAASIYAGIMLAIESKVSVINISMVGYDTEANAIVKEAINEAINNGITVIGAAGNHNMSAKKFIPGSVSDAIIVGAANDDGTKYSTSNYDADLYVTATSTSEATAIYTGLYTAGSLDDERIFTSLVADTEEDTEEATEATTEETAENTTDNSKTDSESSENTSEDSSDIDFPTADYIREFQRLYAFDGFDIEYEINDDGTITFIYVPTEFETAMDATATNCIKSCGEVSADLFTTTSTGTTIQTGTCTLTAGSSAGTGTVSGFSGSGMFTNILSAAGINSLSVCCDRHWDDDTDSAYAGVISSGTVYYKAVLKSYTESDGEAKVTIDILISKNSDFSTREWYTNSRTFNWSISVDYYASSVYEITASISGATSYSRTVYAPTSEISNVVSLMSSEITSTMSDVVSDIENGYAGKRNLTTSGTAPYTSTTSVSGSLTYSWQYTNQSQIYRGRITATAPLNVYLTLTKDVSSDGDDFISYCESIGLDYYSLVGTKIEVFTNSDCTDHLKDVDGHNVTFTVTDEGTLSKTFEIDAKYAGTIVYIKETAVGTGYAIDSTPVKYTLPAAGETGTYTITNEPLNDPVSLQLVKVSDTTGTNTSWSGETSGVGATYTITGYTLGNNNSKGSQFYTWTAATDENGIIDFYDADYYTSGDVYTNSLGVVVFPIGYYTIEEAAVTLSSGTKINSTTYTFIIYPNTDNTKLNFVLKDSNTTLYSYIDGEYDCNDDYVITLADGTTISGISLNSDDIPVLKTLEEEEWAKLGLFKTDNAYIEAGYVSNNDVLTTTNAGTSFEDAVFNIYVDSSKVENFNKDTFFTSERNGHTYSLEAVSSVTVSDQLGNEKAISVSGLYQVLVDGEPLTITTNSTGSGTTDYELPYSDAYVAYEVEAPEGFTYNTNKITFSTSNWVTSSALTTVTAADGTVIQKSTMDGSYYYADIVAADNSTRTGMVVETAYYYGIKFTKGDYDNGTEQGDANLNGIQFAVVNRTGSTVMLNSNHVTANLSNVDYSSGTLIEDGAVVAIVTTANIDGTDGVFYINGLPYGEYEVYELRADNNLSVGDDYDSSNNLGTSIYANKYPELNANDNTADYPSMLFDALDLNFTLNSSTNGKIYTTDDDNTNIVNHVVRGGFTIYKYDEETQTNTALGGASLKAEFNVINRSETTVAVDYNENGVIDDDEYFEPGDVCFTFYTDANTGEYTSASDLLPYGVYDIVEVTPPEGYLMYSEINTDFTVTLEIRENGVIVTEGTYTNANNETEDTELIIYDTVARGDIYLVKKASDTKKAMAYIPFLITSYDQDGNAIESHIVYTDSNGVYSSANDYVLHSYKTNYGDNAVYNEETGYWESDCTGRVGTWFGLGTTVSDDLRLTETGALPYGMYTIEELPCEANEGYALYSDTFYIGAERSKTNSTIDPLYYYLGTDVSYIDFGTIYDDVDTPPTPEIGTTLTDSETGDHISNPDEEVTLIDTVSYTNLTVGKTYTVKGVLMDKATGKELVDADGNTITATTTFTATATSGTVDIKFTFDGSTLAGTSTVAFETVYYNGKEVATHADIDDEGQTVDFPEIGTTLTDSETEDHISNPDEEVTLIDTVSYTNLTIGKTYTVKGVLMDKATGKELVDADGNTITATTTFTATATSGTVDIKFTLDGSSLAGTSTVAFETVYYNGKEVATHADINDEGQTVDFPSIHTTAVDKETGTHEGTVSSTCAIIDTVTYTNLIVGKEYTVIGVLMNKSTGEELLDANGNTVAAEMTFTAESSNGSIDMVFTFDSSLLAGTSVVAFETIYYEGVEIAVHNDLTDEGQTVDFPPTTTTTNPPTTTTNPPKTGASVPVVPITASIFALAIAGLGVLLIKRRKATK